MSIDNDNKPAPTMARMLPTCRAMEYAQVSERTLHRWYEQGLLQKYRVGGRLRWSMDELAAMSIANDNKPAPTMARMLPTCRAMEYAQVSERTLHRWYEQGLLQKYRAGGRLRWSMDELDALIVGRVAS